MARGWESKSVESQIEDRDRDSGARKTLSPEEIERARKRESLEMSRRRIVNELASARSPVHRTALENALKHLDEELRRIVPLIVLVVLFAFGCGHTYADLDTGTQPPQGMSLHVTGVRQVEQGLVVDVEIRNDSAVEFRYFGYSPAHPLFEYEHLTERAWVKQSGFWCGTDLYGVSLAPGQRIAATASVSKPNRLQRLRVGVKAEDGSYTIWTSVIDPITLRVGPQNSL